MSKIPSIALRNVGRNRRRTLITAVTIIFGVAMVLLVRGVTEGVKAVLINDIVNVRTGAIQVHKKGYVESLEAVPTGLNLPWTKEFRDRLAKIPHVTGVSGRVNFNGLVSNGTSQTMFVGRGLDMATETKACPKSAAYVIDGRALNEQDGNSVLLGVELARSLESKPGDTVTLTSSSPNGRANALDLKVQGLFASNLPFENKRVVTVPLQVAQALVGLDGRVTEYVLAVDDLQHLDATAQALRAELGDEYEVHTWADLAPFVRDLINRMLFILATISLVLFVVVVTGVINTILMSVYERVREVGTMLAVGVRRAQVRTMFVIESAAIGLLGGLGGAALGRVLIAAIAARGIEIQLSGLSVSNVLRPFTSWTFTLAAVGAAVVTSTLAALWPAWRASRLDPVVALRST